MDRLSVQTTGLTQGQCFWVTTTDMNVWTGHQSILQSWFTDSLFEFWCNQSGSVSSDYRSVNVGGRGGQHPSILLLSPTTPARSKNQVTWPTLMWSCLFLSMKGHNSWYNFWHFSAMSDTTHFLWPWDTRSPIHILTFILVIFVLCL